MNVQDKVTYKINEKTGVKEVDWTHQDTDVERQGKKIILPADPAHMPIPDAIKALQRKQKDEDQTFNQREVIEGYPLDGAVAFVKAMQREYGWASPVPTPGFFGPTPPEMKSVKIGAKRTDVIQVPWGSFMVPGIENRIQIDSDIHDGRPCLVVYGQVRKREQHVLLQLVVRARDILREESIYRGQSVSLKVDENGCLTLEEPPEFIDVSGVKQEDLILNSDTMDQVETNLFTPLKFTADCRTHKIPLKRGVLLSGPYGTGKTLTARTTAAVANQNGWTFISLDKVKGLEAALKFAEQYAPAVLFAEDIDRMLNERDEAANDLVNTIDGVLSKNSEVITVLTTNHVENIQPVMLRPGRLDAVISIDPPDAGAAIKLVRLYARKLIKADEDLSPAGDVLSGQIPATIREIVERSKLSMIGRQATTLSATDLVIAANGMSAHLALLNKPRAEPSAAERLASSLVEVISGSSDAEGFDENALNQTFSKLARYVNQKNAETQNVVVRTGKEIAGAVANTEEKISNRLGAQTDALADHTTRAKKETIIKVIDAIESK